VKTINKTAMKRITGLTVAALSALILGACSSSQLAHQGEVDDMYYGSADRQRESYKDVNFNAYSSFREDANPLKLDGEEDLTVDNYSAKTLNPDYISKYNSELSEEESSEYGEGDYYAEGYDSSEDEKSTIINNYYGSGYGIPYRYNYRYYDPFYWDPFYSGYYYGSGIRVTISYSYGWGYNRWNNWYLYDSYYGYSPSWVYAAMYCPPSGFYYGSYYGGGYYSSYGYSNSLYYNNSYVNINPDNINGNTRKIVKGPRPSRGVVSSLTENNNSRSTVSNITNPSRSRTQTITDAPSQSSYYRRSRQDNQIISRDEIDRNSASRTTPQIINQRSTQSTRTSTNYVRPKTNRSSLYDVRTNQRSSGYQVNPNTNNNTRQRSSQDFNRQNSNQQWNRTAPGSNRDYQINRSSTPSRSTAPARSNVAPARSSTEKSSGTRSGNNNSSSSRPARKN
jgi:hypothetical protein